jgi:parallel beta-helix repeat protein
MALTKVTYSMIEGASINVSDYGAVGDGTTDDATALNAAIQASITSNGQVYFPHSATNVYLINSSLVIPSNTTLYFAPNVTIKLKNGANCAILKNSDFVGGNTNIKVYGGIFDSNKVNQSVTFATLDFDNITNSIFENCFINGSFTVGYVGLGAFSIKNSSLCLIENCSLVNAGSEGLYLIDCTDMVVSGGEYYDCTNGSGCATDGGARNTFVNVYSHNNAGTQFSINGTFSKILGCTAKNSTLFGGIVLGHTGVPGDNSVIDGCLVIDCVGNGIAVQASTTNAIISNNQISGITGATSSGIRISDSSSFVTVDGNVIFDNANFGILISTGVNSNIITNNLLRENVANAIQLNVTSNNLLSGNVIFNNQANGIFMNAGSVNNVIEGNRCFNNQIFGVYSLGNNNLISNNMLAGNLTAGLEAFGVENLANNVLDAAAPTRFSVTLDAGTSTVVSNANIQSVTRVSFIPTSANAITRGVYRSAQGSGTITFTHTAGGAADTIQVIIE